MKLIVVTSKNWLYNLDVPVMTDLASLKTLCRIECGISSSAQITLVHDGRPLEDDSKTIAECGILEGDTIKLVIRVVARRSRKETQASSDIGGEAEGNKSPTDSGL